MMALIKDFRMSKGFANPARAGIQLGHNYWTKPGLGSKFAGHQHGCGCWGIGATMMIWYQIASWACAGMQPWATAASAGSAAGAAMILVELRFERGVEYPLYLIVVEKHLEPK